MSGARAARVLLLTRALSLGCAVLGSCAVLAGCAPLPNFEANECGNRVVEEAIEDCDGFPAESGAECREPGSVGECHFDCTRGTDGLRPACPTGWGCDAGGICRRPTGEFETLRELEVGSATQLMSGDFDGDGRSDLVSLEPTESLGITRLKVHYFDASAALSETHAFPLRILAPLVGNVTDDALSDILFSDPRVGLLRGRSDRSWLPDAFSSYRVANTGIRVLSISPAAVERTTGFLVFGSLRGEPGVFIADSNSAGMTRQLAPLPAPVEGFAGEPAGGHLFEDRTLYPCQQALVAMAGESRFLLFDACTTRPGEVDPVWREQAEQHVIELEPPAPVDAGPLISDLNGDQHLDVLIGAGGLAYVSYGDGQRLATAVPYLPAIANLPQPLLGVPMPLAVGDVTADGAPDFLLPDGLFLSRPSSGGSGFDYSAYAQHALGYWDHGLAADLNGNGRLDFVAASSEHPGIDFFNGTGSIYLTEFTVPTSRPVQQLIVGDFNGDQLLDLGLSQATNRANPPDSVLIAYGAPFGPPEPPVPVARMNGIEQLSSVREGADDHLVVSSGEWRDEIHTGALALLAASGDRVPLASFDLTTFAEDGSTDGSAAVRLAAGSLLAPGNRDVLALAFGNDADGNLRPDEGLQAWLLPALAKDGTPARLATEFDPALAPVSTTNASTPLSLSALALDLDGDGIEEVVLAAPLLGGARCSLAAFAVTSTQLVGRGRWALDEPCARVELGSFDGDADGALDLILLTGPGPDSGGTLSIFWNDGHGGFAPERRTLLMDAAPLAFAVLKSSAARPLTLAVVNPEGLWLVAATQQAREFEPPQSFLSRADCTGVTAADFNGDAALDLAYTASGNVTVLKAILETR
ncbi:MAG: hypothetical protein RL033_2231 [Pseudomonadota bacterium]